MPVKAEGYGEGSQVVALVIWVSKIVSQIAVKSSCYRYKRNTMMCSTDFRTARPSLTLAQLCEDIKSTQSFHRFEP